MKAINIIWDVDDPKEMNDLPAEIEIPEGMTDTEEISDYITELTGFCHKGFDVLNDAPKLKVIICDGVVRDVIKPVGLNVMVEFIKIDTGTDDERCQKNYRERLYDNPLCETCDYSSSDFRTRHNVASLSDEKTKELLRKVMLNYDMQIHGQSLLCHDKDRGDTLMFSLDKAGKLYFQLNNSNEVHYVKRLNLHFEKGDAFLHDGYAHIAAKESMRVPQRVLLNGTQPFTEHLCRVVDTSDKEHLLGNYVWIIYDQVEALLKRLAEIGSVASEV